MSDHDPICRRTFINAEDCICAELREYGERIAQAIEAVDPVEWALAGQDAGRDAARIARRGGSDG